LSGEAVGARCCFESHPNGKDSGFMKRKVEQAMASSNLAAKVALAALLSALSYAPLHAADMQQPVSDAPVVDPWRVSVAPYLWGAGLNGDVGLFGLEPVNIDMSFGDILKDLRFG